MEKLKTFYFVAKLKSFTKAAEVLALSQPAVSFQIKSLEEEYGTVLFERIGREVSLTEAGEILFQHVEKIINELEAIDLALKRYADPLKGTVRLGASILCSTYLIPPILGKFRSLYPSVSFKIRARYAQEILKLLLENEVDFGIMGEGSPIDENIFDTSVLFQDELVFVTSKTQPKERKTVNLKDLTSEKLIMPESHSALRKFIDRQFQACGLAVEPYIEVGNIEVVKKLVEQGFGSSILSYISVKEEVRDGKLMVHRIEGLELRRNVILVKRRGKVISPSSEFFIEFLSKELNERKNEFQITE